MARKASITIYDIADALELSPSTISRALSGNTLIHKDTRKRILEKAQDMGFRLNFFASRLRKQRTNVIGALMPHLNNAFISNIVSGAEVTSRVGGYSLLVGQSMNVPDCFVSILENFTKSRVDGMLIINSCASNSGIPEFLTANIHTPAIVIQDSWKLTSTNCRKKSLIIKNSYDLTDRLIKQGSKRILYMASAFCEANADVFDGYRQALNANKFPDSVIPETTTFDSEESAMNICKKVMSMESRPDGILLLSSNMIAAISIPDVGNCISCPSDDNLLWLSNNQRNFSDSGSGFFELGKLATKMLIGLMDNLQDE